MTSSEPIKGVVLDDAATLTITEVCEACGLKESLLIEMVREGIAEPLDLGSSRMEFSGVAVTRLLTAYRLQRDLHVNLPGAALALELLDEITALRTSRKQ